MTATPYRPAETYAIRVTDADGTPTLVVRTYDLEGSFMLEAGRPELAAAIDRARRPIPGDGQPGFFARLAAADPDGADERPTVPAAA